METLCRQCAEVEVHFRHEGERAFFIVEVGNRLAARELADYLAAMPGETRLIALGPVVACAARVPPGVASPFAAMAEHLRDRYSLSICEPGFTPSLYRVALQLARDSEGELHPVEMCSVCGAPDPFPTTLRVSVGDSPACAAVCERCVRESAGSDAAEWTRRLLGRLGGHFARWQAAHLDGRQDGAVWRFQATLAEAVPARAE